MKRSALAIAAATVSATLAWAANTPLDVKTGLWDMGYVTKFTGPGAPSRPPISSSDKDCITAQDLQKGAFTSNDDEEQCKYTPVVATATHNESTVKCADGQTGKMTVDALSREKVTGNITMTRKGQTITIDITGKWLNAACGAVQ